MLQIHDTLIERFGGAYGLRDAGLLASALAAPQATFAGTRLHSSLADMAASYLISLTRNHPFVDGNKRTAYAVAATFVRLNGYRLALSQNEKFELVLRIAEGRLDKAEVAAKIASGLTKL